MQHIKAKYITGELIGLRKESKYTHSIYIGEKYCGSASLIKDDNIIVTFKCTVSEIKKIIDSEILHLL